MIYNISPLDSPLWRFVPRADYTIIQFSGFDQRVIRYIASLQLQRRLKAQGFLWEEDALTPLQPE